MASPLLETQLSSLRDGAISYHVRDCAVSLDTLRTHTKNVYAKLGVNSRRAAVRRAGELDLL